MDDLNNSWFSNDASEGIGGWEWLGGNGMKGYACEIGLVRDMERPKKAKKLKRKKKWGEARRRWGGKGKKEKKGPTKVTCAFLEASILGQETVVQGEKKEKKGKTPASSYHTSLLLTIYHIYM